MTTDYAIDMGSDPEKILLLGDTHHDAGFVKKVIDHAAHKQVDTIIQVGDMGWWPQRGDCDDYFDQVDLMCRKAGINLFWVDGNHEDHDSLVPGFKYGQRIQHLPRGFRWQWWGKTWMSVGGGASVDSQRRTPGFDWFPQETLTWDEYEYCLRPGKVDIIVSHDCPDQVIMPGLDSKARMYPEQAIRESERHRTLIGQICDTTRPDFLWHGHYHLEHRSLRTGKNGWKTAVTGLHNNEVHLSHSVQIITRADVGAQEVDHAVSG